jgi:enoyl-CoA hydratase
MEATMDIKYILLSKNKGIATVTLNRPDSLNAFNWEMWNQLESVLEGAMDDNSIKVIILTGAGRAFSAGMDVKMQHETLWDHEKYIKLEYRICNYVENLEKPTIAAVNGYALGNACELSLSCDIRIAGKSAKFGYPEALLGNISPALRLARTIGIPRAKEILFTGRNVDANEAERIGLVSKTVPNTELQKEAIELGKRIMGTSPLGLKYTKQAINMAMCYPPLGSAFETQSALITIVSEDAKEGLLAFKEKRKPDFKGK